MNAYTTEFFAACPKCGKKFRVHLAVRDHMRDAWNRRTPPTTQTGAEP